jgi:hypothetical protein
VARNMDLFRTILLMASEQDDKMVSPRMMQVPGYEEYMVARHIRLLEDAGFVEANILNVEGQGDLRGMVERVTNQGYDFLDSIRDESVWNRTQEFVKSKGGGFTLGMLAAVAEGFVKQRLGIP